MGGGIIVLLYYAPCYKDPPLPLRRRGIRYYERGIRYYERGIRYYERGIRYYERGIV